jgi:hypothetical protein
MFWCFWILDVLSQHNVCEGVTPWVRRPHSEISITEILDPSLAANNILRLFLLTFVEVLSDVSACTFCFQKKRVWFPDPEVSDTVLFYARDSVRSSAGSRKCTSCPQAGTLVRSRRRARLLASFNTDTSVHDESPVSTHSANVTTAYRCANGNTGFQNETLMKGMYLEWAWTSDLHALMFASETQKQEEKRVRRILYIEQLHNFYWANINSHQIHDDSNYEKNMLKFFYQKAQGKRSLGRCKRGMENNIKMDLKIVGHEDKACILFAQERIQSSSFLCESRKVLHYLSSSRLQNGCATWRSLSRLWVPQTVSVHGSVCVVWICCHELIWPSRYGVWLVPFKPWEG